MFPFPLKSVGLIPFFRFDFQRKKLFEKGGNDGVVRILIPFFSGIVYDGQSYNL